MTTTLNYATDFAPFFGNSQRAKQAFGFAAQKGDSKVIKIKNWVKEEGIIEGLDADGDVLLKEGWAWAARKDGSKIVVKLEYCDEDGSVQTDAIEKSQRDIFELVVGMFLQQPLFMDDCPLKVLDKKHVHVANFVLGTGALNQVIERGSCSPDTGFWQLCMSGQIMRNTRMNIFNLMLSHFILLGFRSEEMPPMDDMIFGD